MDINKAAKIYKMIKKTKLEELKQDVLTLAVRYAEIRTEWAFLPLDVRKEKDQLRTTTHNAFISACNALARNMKKRGEDVSWHVELGSNRLDIGDFACYLHCLIGLEMR